MWRKPQPWFKETQSFFPWVCCDQLYWPTEQHRLSWINPSWNYSSSSSKAKQRCFSSLGHSCSQCQNWGSSILLTAMSIHAMRCSIPSCHVRLLPSHGLPKLCSKSCFNHHFQDQQFPLCELDYWFLLGHSKTDLKVKISVMQNSNYKCTHTAPSAVV